MRKGTINAKGLNVKRREAVALILCWIEKQRAPPAGLRTNTRWTVVKPPGIQFLEGREWILDAQVGSTTEMGTAGPRGVVVMASHRPGAPRKLGGR
jgi:hypothetical protein